MDGGHGGIEEERGEESAVDVVDCLSGIRFNQQSECAPLCCEV